MDRLDLKVEEVLAILFAAAIHDLQHPGVTNDYLVQLSSSLALRYNDRAVAESNSASVVRGQPSRRSRLCVASGSPDGAEHLTRSPGLRLRHIHLASPPPAPSAIGGTLTPPRLPPCFLGRRSAKHCSLDLACSTG